VAKKTDKVVKDLAKQIKKLRKENEKLVETLEKSQKDQAKSNKKILALLEERSVEMGTVTGEPEEHTTQDENGGPETTQTATEASEDQETPDASSDNSQDTEEGPEVTDAAKRRADELGVDPTGVKGTGSGGRVLVKDVEAAAGQ
jgi:pyruvate/2-oxoglutarate dehydrogenase complex dihydrolipoamide acyltransferase (E2) component